MKKTSVIDIAKLCITSLGVVLYVCHPATAQTQVREWVPTGQSSQSEASVIRTVLPVGGAYQYLKIAHGKESTVAEHLKMFGASEEKTGEYSPKIHKILTSKPSQIFSRGLLIGTSVFATYTTISPLLNTRAQDQLSRQRADTLRSQDSQKKP